MEESFLVANFNPKKWLASNLELASPDSLDVQLSELNFNLGLYKNQLEESIKNSQNLIQSKAESIESDIFEISKEFSDLQEKLETQVSGQKSLNNLRTNEVLFVEISEISLIKARLNDSLQMMDLIMSLDFHFEEIVVFLEERNLKDLDSKVEGLAELFKLITKLPFLDSRREKYETLLQKIKEFISQLFMEKLSDTEKMSVDCCSAYKISKSIGLEYLFLEFYNSMRLERIVKNFTEACKSSANENLDFLEIFAETIKREIDYFSELFNNKLGELMSEVIREVSLRLMSHLIETFYSKTFQNHEYQPHIIVYLTSYLKLCKFLINHIEQGVIVNKADIAAIENTCFTIFLNIPHNFLNAEVKQNNKSLLKKIKKELEKSKETQNFEEKISSFSLLKIPEIIEASFQRVHEVLFGTELEEWILGIQKVGEEIFQKMYRVLDELEFKNFNHAVLDSLLVFGKNVLRKEESATLNDLKEKKFQVNNNLSLIELLLDKFEELLYIEETMAKLDKDIRVKIIESQSFIFPDIYQKVQRFLLENKSGAKAKSKTLVLSLKTGLVIFEGLFNGISQCKNSIQKLLLKIFLSESFNRMIEYAYLPVWKESEAKQQVLTFQKITEQISNICQNFFLHMQIFEEIKKGLEKNSAVSNHLDSFDNIDKAEILRKLYFDKLKYEGYLFEGDPFENEERKQSKDMVDFWGTLYAHFLIKLYAFVLKSINEVGIVGKKQLKMDGEYLLNVLQEHLSEGSKAILEELMNFLKVNEGKKVVYLKERGHTV